MVICPSNQKLTAKCRTFVLRVNQNKQTDVPLFEVPALAGCLVISIISNQLAKLALM